MNASTFRIISQKAKVETTTTKMISSLPRLYYHVNLEGEDIHSNGAIKMPENVQQPQNHGSLCKKIRNATTHSCEKEQ